MFYRVNGSPFSTCEKGHDLTKPNAFYYDNSNRRFCRECTNVSSKKNQKTARRTFS
jgi:hypothetical protein